VDLPEPICFLQPRLGPAVVGFEKNNLGCRSKLAPFDLLMEGPTVEPFARIEEKAMKFAFLGYHVENNWASMSKSEQDAMIADCFAYDRELLKKGHMRDDGAALQATQTAKTLRWKNGAVVVTDGPFAETKEQLGGLGVMEADDMNHAVELMSRHPGLRHGSTFEIRPIDEEALKRQTESVAAWRRAAGTAPSTDAKFATMGYIRADGWDSMPCELEAMIEQCKAFDEVRVKSGQWQSGIALHGARTAKTLRGTEGKVVVTDGPFAETKEYLGGVVVLAFKDLDHAVASLSKHPALPFGVTIEIRPIHEEIDRLWDSLKR
jgi:hypothetical protein